MAIECIFPFHNKMKDLYLTIIVNDIFSIGRRNLLWSSKRTNETQQWKYHRNKRTVGLYSPRIPEWRWNRQNQKTRNKGEKIPFIFCLVRKECVIACALYAKEWFIVSHWDPLPSLPNTASDKKIPDSGSRTSGCRGNRSSHRSPAGTGLLPWSLDHNLGCYKYSARQEPE